MKMSGRYILYGIIIFICIIALGLGIFWQFTNNGLIQGNLEEKIDISAENAALAKNFTTIFNNTLDYQGYNVDTMGVAKLDSTKDLIYTAASKTQVVEGRYDINLNIPKVNISNNLSVEKFNEKVQSLFVDKANDIIKNAMNNTVYSIDYAAYVNTNILSLVIRSTLKEGNNPQRVIIQTYNYNLSTNEAMTLQQLLEIKGLQTKAVENTILAKVTEADTEAQNLKKLGYNVYSRDLTSNIYQIANTDNYILGKNNKLYLIYPYGNANYTDEIDVIVF